MRHGVTQRRGQYNECPDGQQGTHEHGNKKYTHGDKCKKDVRLVGARILRSHDAYERDHVKTKTGHPDDDHGKLVQETDGEQPPTITQQPAPIRPIRHGRLFLVHDHIVHDAVHIPVDKQRGDQGHNTGSKRQPHGGEELGSPIRIFERIGQHGLQASGRQAF